MSRVLRFLSCLAAFCLAGSAVADPVAAARSGEVVLLENCRVNIGEKKNDEGLSKRIAALCDVYDALTSVRPYKKAWSSEEAVNYIVGESGGAFEPRLVGLFVESLPEIQEISTRFSDLPVAVA